MRRGFYHYLLTGVLLLIPVSEGVAASENITIEQGDFNGVGQTITFCEEPAFTLEGEEASLRNVRLVGCEGVKVPAIEMTGNNHEIEQVTIETEGVAINAIGTKHSKISDVRINGDGQTDGIVLEASERITLSSSEITNVRDAVYLEEGGGHRIEHVTVDLSRYGVHMMFSNDNTVLKSTFKQNVTGLMVMGTDRSRLLQNIVRQHTGASAQGIMLYEAENSTVSGNDVSANQVGLSVEGSTGTMIRKNRISENNLALRFKTTNGMTVVDNDLRGNRYPLFVRDAFDNVLSGNRFDSELVIDLDRDRRNDLVFRADPYLYLLSDRYEALELVYDSPGLVVLEHLLKSQDESVLVDHAPRFLRSNGLHFSFTFSAFTTLMIGIIGWRLGRKTK
ncbi:right-handed parallel beta-helix repeat-containing protein [Exiguobacterium flavidum]|uniref:right-handed parallel beta-helix repeat-containing protein n=1 Tax=Exiguobacterium flavidum TaxID=2184695 RepID=UPI000DF7BE91|nr:NosD domain-containing protein [Exiguobacterium flavidum]